MYSKFEIEKINNLFKSLAQIEQSIAHIQMFANICFDKDANQTPIFTIENRDKQSALIDNVNNKSNYSPTNLLLESMKALYGLKDGGYTNPNNVQEQNIAISSVTLELDNIEVGYVLNSLVNVLKTKRNKIIKELKQFNVLTSC